MTEKINLPLPEIEDGCTIPPGVGEPTRRDGYKWSSEDNLWIVDVSQSQTRRFEKMLAKNPNDISLRASLNKERQLDGFEQRLRERAARESK